MRHLWLQVHLWFGLTLGVLGILVGVTGRMMWLRKRRANQSARQVSQALG